MGHRLMTLARFVVASAVVSWCVVYGALACSSAQTTPSDASTEARADAGSNDGRESDVRENDASDSSVPGPPLLTLLDVSASDAAPPVALVPAFSSAIHDYYVRCPAAENTLLVTMKASPGSNAVLTAPVHSGASPSQSVWVHVAEDQAIVATAVRGTATTEYWVRCLPSDFPTLQWDAHPEAGTPTPGYYLVGNTRPVPSTGYAMVIDGHGVPVWYHRVIPGSGAYGVDNVVSGAISFKAFPATTPYEVQQLSPWTTTPVSPTGLFENEHELRLLPNGDFLVFVYPTVSGYDLTGLAIALPDGGAQPLGPDSTIQDCEVVEFEPTGNVVWKWKATDHFDPVKDSTYPQPGPPLPGDGGLIVDVFHFNSIDVEPTSGNLLVSARHMDSVFFIERSTGRVLWKMGGPVYSKDDATYVPVAVADRFYRQHDARLQPGWVQRCSGGSGQVSLFDDETSEPGPARGVVYDVTVAPGDGGATADCGAAADASSSTQATVSWQYKGPSASNALGSMRISADGSRVIGWGGIPGRVFTEVDLAGHALVDLSFGSGDISYRAIKIPTTAFDLATLRGTAGHP